MPDTTGEGATPNANNQGNGGNGGTSEVQRLLDYAMQFRGVPYKWGGTSPDGFDCSGLVQYVFNHYNLRNDVAGGNLPRVSSDQGVTGKPVKAADARPGDLVYFTNEPGDRPGIDHIAIYLGHGQMLVAPHTGTDVQIQPVGNAAGFRRVLPHSAWQGLPQNNKGEYEYQPDGQQLNDAGMNVSDGAQNGSKELDTPKQGSVKNYLNNPNIESQYGYLAAFIHQPEIGPILAKAAKNGWSQQRLFGAISQTHWWKTTSDSARNWQSLQKLDPGSALQQLKTRKQEIQQLAKSTLGTPLDGNRVNQLANASLAADWDQAQLQHAVGAEFQFQGRNAAYKGAAGQTVDQLQQLSQQYLVPISHNSFQKWSKQILEGTTTVNDYQSYLQSQAESLYPTLTHALKQGQTVQQFADPYLQMASQILEKPVGDFNLFNPKWGKALNQTQPDGSRSPMSLSDWGDYLRSLPEYGNTQQAQQQAAGFASSLANIFGKIDTGSSSSDLNASTAVTTS